MYLEHIKGPADVKALRVDQLQTLADETRAALINRISKIGGHSGPNLGVVELTVALHYVFASPTDKIIFDVSHQCYPHKILTGRSAAYVDDAHFRDVSGYTNPLESEHDHFAVGHTSTSISLALGMAKGRDLCGRHENVIALIGDGSLSGGEALEGLDYAGEYDRNLIIIVNDNDQSIAENHGGLYKALAELRRTKGAYDNNPFRAMGLDYRYVEEGHDIPTLVDALTRVKDIDHPVVLHVHTIKGKGLPYAEQNREAWHAGGPFDVATGTPKYQGEPDTTVRDSLIRFLDETPNGVVLNSATPMGLGFSRDIRDRYTPKGRFVDVGIAEENAVAMASGIAKAGGNVVYGTYAPFFQRTYDQLSHDLCLNDNPATLLVLSPGVYGMTSNTHIGMCDIQMFAHIPNLVYLAPAYREEYLAMFAYATRQTAHPVAIRVPARLVAKGEADTTDYSVLRNKVEQRGAGIALIAVGILLPLAMRVAGRVQRETGHTVTVINPRFLTGVDEGLLTELQRDHHLILTIEDGEVMGGYGQTVTAFYGESTMKVRNYGISKAFHTDFVPEELLAHHGISEDNLVQVVKENL